MPPMVMPKWSGTCVNITYTITSPEEPVFGTQTQTRERRG